MTSIQWLVEQAYREHRARLWAGHRDADLTANPLTTVKVFLAKRYHLVIELKRLELDTIGDAGVGIMLVIGLQYSNTVGPFPQIKEQQQKLDTQRKHEQPNRPPKSIVIDITKVDELRRQKIQNRQDTQYHHDT